MKAFLVIAALLVLTQAKVKWPLEPCGTAKDTVTFTELYMSVKPAKATTPEITLYGDVAETLTFGEVTITAKLNGVTMQILHVPYTKAFAAGDPLTYIYNNEIPGFTPSVPQF